MASFIYWWVFQLNKENVFESLSKQFGGEGVYHLATYFVFALVPIYQQHLDIKEHLVDMELFYSILDTFGQHK